MGTRKEAKFLENWYPICATWSWNHYWAVSKSALLCLNPRNASKCLPKVAPAHCIQHRRNPSVTSTCFLLLPNFSITPLSQFLFPKSAFIYRKRRTKRGFPWQTGFYQRVPALFRVFCCRCRHKTHSLIDTGGFDWVVRSKQETPWWRCQDQICRGKSQLISLICNLFVTACKPHQLDSLLSWTHL